VQEDLDIGLMQDQKPIRLLRSEANLAKNLLGATPLRLPGALSHNVSLDAPSNVLDRTKERVLLVASMNASRC